MWDANAIVYNKTLEEEVDGLDLDELLDNYTMWCKKIILELINQYCTILCLKIINEDNHNAGPINIKWISKDGRFVLWPKDEAMSEIYGNRRAPYSYFNQSDFIDHFHKKSNASSFYECFVYTYGADGLAGMRK